MNLGQVIVVAMRALMRNKMRSFLTALGIVIGVGAVIAMTAIGAGAKARVEQTFAAMGSNLLMLRPGSSNIGGAHGGVGTMPTLTWSDLKAISEELPSVRSVAPLLSASAQVAAEGQNWATNVQGTTPEYFAIRNWSAQRGSVFSDSDNASGAKVAVIGQTVLDNLFGPYTNPIGEIVRIKNVPFEIIGVAEKKGASAFGRDQDDVVFIPETTFRAKVEGGLEQYINGNVFIGADSPEATTQAQAEVEQLLRTRHRIQEGMPDDFNIRNLSDIATAQQEGARTMTSLLAGIAFVSLFVGGIGIMNIMLVSVTERTREIGLRMAVGAKPKSILVQFMVEAVALSIIGGVFGVLFGLGSAYYLVAKFDWPMLVQVNVVVMAVVFSAIVGIGFGLYPAYKASRLDPIQALRYE